MSVLLVIPGRYAATRYPGKPRAELKGASGEVKSLIRRSWEAACAVKSVDRVVVATDDDRIKVASEAFGAEVVMTSPDCANGTERCAEAFDVLGGGYGIVVNLRGCLFYTSDVGGVGRSWGRGGGSVCEKQK